MASPGRCFAVGAVQLKISASSTLLTVVDSRDDDPARAKLDQRQLPLFVAKVRESTLSQNGYGLQDNPHKRNAKLN